MNPEDRLSHIKFCILLEMIARNNGGTGLMKDMEEFEWSQVWWCIDNGKIPRKRYFYDVDKLSMGI